jgi:deoxyribodipyrimidine photolyase-related protein
MKLRLILGDQLNIRHSWFTSVHHNTLYVLIELKQEQEYVKHHIQKIIGFFSAMRNFAEALSKMGHRVLYFDINNPDNTGHLASMIAELIKKHSVTEFEYLLPDEYRLDEQLRNISNSLSINTSVADTEHFITKRTDLKTFFAGKKTRVMESFYRNMRKNLNVLMENEAPTGGRWNYDDENRKTYDKKVPLPKSNFQGKDVSEIKREIDKAGIRYFGNVEVLDFNWPISRAESLIDFTHFLETRLSSFGTYEDAMLTEHTILFHSRISFALNTKMVSPMELVQLTLAYWEKNKIQINISQVEGFIRQIIGWREFIRGIYWEFMPAYKTLNYLNAYNKVPDWFWSGDTKMNCMKQCIQNSLDNAYAHHIQRLMVIGNFSLLAGLNPDELDNWYLGVYADAIEWVELPNTRGMSQFADGGIVGTKPYVSSANYISKMSNYCKGCHYNAKEKTSENACPFNSMYWKFYDLHRSKFEKNPRVGMVYMLWNKMKIEDKSAILTKAESLLENLENL